VTVNDIDSSSVDEKNSVCNLEFNDVYDFFLLTLPLQ
jgi:hypothetical protein